MYPTLLHVCTQQSLHEHANHVVSSFSLLNRLELNGHRRRLAWEATPRSIHEGVSSAIMNSDCLVFDTSIAQLFADNGNLGINVTISMC